MKKVFLSILVTFIITVPMFSQGTAGAEAKFEYRSLIDMPSAGILQKGFVGVSTDVLPGGVLISKLEVGVFDGISFGISYGGANLIGSGAPDWYKLPAVNLRVRVLEEGITLPAVSVGFDSQGKGLYFDQFNRYEIKSPGFYAAAAKNFEFLGYLSFHGAVNYSLESKDGDNFMNVALGVEKTIGTKFSVVAEYDFAFNDDNSVNFGKGNGYMNAGFRWTVGNGFTIGFDIRNLFNNKKWNPDGADRGIRIEYIQSIF